jgi:hypothetical protein
LPSRTFAVVVDIWAIPYHARRTAASGFRARATAPGTPATRRRGETRGTSVAERWRMRIVAIVVSVLWLTVPARADELTTVLGGRVDRVVAAGDGVAALRPDEVALVARDGRVVARCGFRAAPRAAPRVDRTAMSADELLRLVDLPEQDESPEAADLLDDEGVAEPRRRVAAPPAPTRALAVAGTTEAAWIGTTDGLWRLDAVTGACARVALAGRAVGVVAAAGRALLAAADDVVFRSDDGRTFHAAAGLTSPARAATLAADGALAFVADGDGVVELLGGLRARRALARPTEALATCGAEVVALADDAVYRLGADADVEALGPRPPARAVACADGRLVAVGVGAWTSADGRAWTEDERGVGATFNDVALTDAGPWLATEDGLRGPVGGERAPKAERPRPRVALPAWTRWLPRLTFTYASWSDASGRAGWHCWALLTFSIDRRARERAIPAPETPR